MESYSRSDSGYRAELAGLLIEHVVSLAAIRVNGTDQAVLCIEISYVRRESADTDERCFQGVLGT